jgi:hypothetical protein
MSRLAVVLAAMLLGCGGGPADTRPAAMSDFRDGEEFFRLPFPSDARASGETADMSRFPNAGASALVTQVVARAAEERGFGTTSGIFFRLTGAIASEVVDFAASLSNGAPIVLVSVDEKASDYLRRYPVRARFLADGGRYGAPNLLAVLPLQGVPLLPKTRYAVVVRDTLLARSPEIETILRGERPAGMSPTVFERYRNAIASLAKAGLGDIASLTVFTTGDPVGTLATVTQSMITAPRPKPNAAFKRNEQFDGYCVYETTIDMPVFQAGEPPFSKSGGGWKLDATGKPVLQRNEAANFVVTIPRQAMPAKGYPIVVFSRTGGGGERPLVDRGVRATAGGAAIAKGTGPAHYFSQAGFAGSSIDGPHGGLRNVTHADEQFLVFNFNNPTALRDNVRQSAAELALQAHILEEVTIDVSDCPGTTAPDNQARLDVTTMAIMGHSMGASIAPLAAAVEPRFRAVLLSGAGSSFIENLIHKQKPLPVLPLATVLLGLAGSDYRLTEHDPLLSILQWVGEAADVAPYADLLARRSSPRAPPHVLMMQGVVDHYQMPPIANATSLAFGLDLGGDALDEKSPALVDYLHAARALELVGRKRIALPASNNVSVVAATITAVLTQHPEDGVEDGHEVVFQTEGPKHEYVCFLKSFRAGAPRVPAHGKTTDACE